MKSLGIIGFFISLGILAYILYNAGIGELAMIYNSADILYVMFALVIYFMSSLVYAFRWNQFIMNMKMKIKFALLCAITWIGFAINSVTPLAISGGEPVKAYYLSRYSCTKKSQTLASVVATSFLDFGSFVILDIAAVMVLYFKFNLPVIILYPLLCTITIGTLVLGSLIYASLNRKASLVVTLFITSAFKKFRILKKRIIHFENDIEHNVRLFNNALKDVSFMTLVSSMGLSVMMRVMDIFRIYIIIIALGFEIDPVFILISIAFGTVAAVVPLLPGSIGAIEPAMIAGLMLGGITLPLATAVVLVERFIVLGCNTIIGFGSMYFMGYHKPIGQIK